MEAASTVSREHRITEVCRTSAFSRSLFHVPSMVASCRRRTHFCRQDRLSALYPDSFCKKSTAVVCLGIMAQRALPCLSFGTVHCRLWSTSVNGLRSGQESIHRVSALLSSCRRECRRPWKCGFQRLVCPEGHRQFSLPAW